MSSLNNMKFKTTARDGNCLFNSIECVLHFEDKKIKLTKKEQKKRAMELRKLTVMYMKQLLVEDVTLRYMLQCEIDDDEDYQGLSIMEYLKMMMEDGEWGGNIEIIVIARMLNRSIEVYHQKKRQYILLGGYQVNSNLEPIRLLYRGQSHYDFIV